MKTYPISSNLELFISYLNIILVLLFSPTIIWISDTFDLYQSYILLIIFFIFAFLVIILVYWRDKYYLSYLQVKNFDEQKLLERIDKLKESVTSQCIDLNDKLTSNGYKLYEGYSKKTLSTTKFFLNRTFLQQRSINIFVCESINDDILNSINMFKGGDRIIIVFTPDSLKNISVTKKHNDIDIFTIQINVSHNNVYEYYLPFLCHHSNKSTIQKNLRNSDDKILIYDSVLSQIIRKEILSIFSDKISQNAYLSSKRY